MNFITRPFIPRFITSLLMTLSLFITLLMVAGCSTNLPDYVKLGDLRVLAMQANTPEVADTGATVTITPYVSDLNGNGRTLTYSYQTCLDPGVGLGATPICSTPVTGPTTFGPVGTTRHTYTGAAPTLTITVPTGFLASSKEPAAPNQFNGVAYLVTYKLASSDGTASVNAFKRIMVSTNPNKNNNPSLSQVLSNTTALSVLPSLASYPSTTVILSAAPSSTSAETYQVQQSDGSFKSETESLITTWFYSDGTLDQFRTENEAGDAWTPPQPHPSGHSTVFVVVLRDGRGGEDIQQIEFQ